jgi:hypothetical protein
MNRSFHQNQEVSMLFGGENLCVVVVRITMDEKSSV